jgi:hypothetical protein
MSTDVAKTEREHLEHQLDRLEKRLPDPASAWLAWVRRPSHRLARIVAGLLLVFGGIFSILPVLGAWMLPLGLLLLAMDFPPLERPVNRVILWGERQWRRWRRWRQARKNERR